MNQGSELPISLTRVVIADDQAEWRQRVRSQLEKHFASQIRIVAEVGETHSIAEQCLESKADLVFLDIHFSTQSTSDGTTGIDVAGQIWRQCPEISIIICSSYTSQDYVQELYENMPDSAVYGWLVKSRIVRDLKTAVTAVLDGDCWVDSDVERIEARLDSSRHLEKNLHDTLMFAALGYSQRAIGALAKVSTKAVEKRMDKVYAQFGLPMKQGDGGVVNHRCRAIWTALEQGYLTEAELRSSKMMLPDDDEIQQLIAKHECSAGEKAK